MVESSGLLNRRSVKNATGGSNPPLSARSIFVTSNASSDLVLKQQIPTFTTERLRLRSLRPGDEEFLARLSTDPLVMQYIHAGALTPDRARREADIEVELAGYRRHFGRWLMEMPASAVRIGWIQLVKFRGPKFDESRSDDLQIDYELDPAFWGHGYMTEAARAVLAYAFGRMELDRVLIYTRLENERSVRLIERLGFGQVSTCLDEFGNTCPLYVLNAEQVTGAAMHH